jgi:hypothetical protein
LKAVSAPSSRRGPELAAVFIASEKIQEEDEYRTGRPKELQKSKLVYAHLQDDRVDQERTRTFLINASLS